MHRSILFTVLTAILMFSALDQAGAQRKSPPATAEGMIGDARITVNYSQPSVRGRVIWGTLVPYGEVWRTGANEATSFETSADLRIDGNTLPAGKYGLYTIPTEDDVTVIFSSVWDTWGTNYSESNDVLRATAKWEDVEKTENFTIVVGKNELRMHWDKKGIVLSIKE